MAVQGWAEPSIWWLDNSQTPRASLAVGGASFTVRDTPLGGAHGSPRQRRRRRCGAALGWRSRVKTPFLFPPTRSTPDLVAKSAKFHTCSPTTASTRMSMELMFSTAVAAISAESPAPNSAPPSVAALDRAEGWTERLRSVVRQRRRRTGGGSVDAGNGREHGYERYDEPQRARVTYRDSHQEPGVRPRRTRPRGTGSSLRLVPRRRRRAGR